MLAIHRAARPLYRIRIGTREVVGPTFFGNEEYIDRVECPCPPIRFKKPTDEFTALREKEKGDWKALSIEDKKKLYRYNFCQTFAEMEAPTCENRKLFGDILLVLSVPIFMYVLLKHNVFPPLPESLSDEGKKNLIRWCIDSRVDPVDGISSKWDYEKNEWKEKPFLLMRSK